MTDTMTKKDPFDFLFFYEFEDGVREEDALLVGDDPKTASPLHLAIGLKEAAKIVIQPISGITTASSTSYHFKLQFSPGILNQPEQITIEGDNWGLYVEGDTILYLLWKGEELTIEGDDFIELMLNGVIATLMSRTSQTNVTLSWEFKQDGITIIDVTARDPGDSNPYNTTATETLEMIQRQGKANIPLYVGFFSSNRVCNINNQQSSLKLRITNTSESDITFLYDSQDTTNRSQLIIALEVGDANTVPWALGTEDQVNDIGVTIFEDQWEKTAGPTLRGGMLEWTFSPKTLDVVLATKKTIVIEFSKIVTAHPTGTANLYLRYKYVPGYQDGEFICPIEKAPLVFSETNVGVGTTTPKQQLQVTGDYYGKGHIWLYANEGDGKTGTAYIQARDDSHLSQINLQLRTQNQDNLVDAIYLKHNGDVGIGTNTPDAKLHISGGDAKISGKANIGGDAFISGQANIEGNAFISGQANIERDANISGSATISGQANIDGNAIVSGNLKFGENTRQMLNLYSDDYGIGVQSNTMYFRTNTQFAWYKGGSHNDEKDSPGGGTLQMRLSEYGWLDIFEGGINLAGGNFRVKNEPAMQLKHYHPNASLDYYDTEMSTSNWIGIIAGIDLLADGDIEGIKVLIEDKGSGRWRLSWDARVSDDVYFWVYVLFIRKEFFS